MSELVTHAQNGDSELLTDFNNVQRKRRVNGERSLSFDLYSTDRNEHSFSLVANKNKIELDGAKYVIDRCEKHTVNGTPIKFVEAQHEIFDYLLNTFQHDQLTGALQITVCMAHIFNDLPYDFEIVGEFSSVQFENFGRENGAKLFSKILDRFGAEYDIDDANKKVIIDNEISNDTDAQLRHGHNLKTLREHIDTSNLSTYIEGYGAIDEDTGEYLVTATYTSPNADKYKDENGNTRLLHADYVYDERFFNYDSLLEEIKSRLKDEPDYNVTLEMVEIKKNGKNIHDFQLGDRVFTIYEPLDIDLYPRVTEIVDFPFSKRSPQITLGSFKNSSTQIAANLANTQKMVQQVMDQEGNISLVTKRIYSNSHVYQDNLGHHYIDPNDASRRVFIGSGGIDVKKGLMRVEREDGYASIIGGALNYDLAITSHSPPFTSANIEVLPRWWRTDIGTPADCQFYTYRHQSRYMVLNLAYYSEDGNAGTFQIVDFITGNPILFEYTFSNSDPQGRDAQSGNNFTVDLGVPDGSLRAFYLRLYSNNGTSFVRLRNRRAWLEG